MTELAAIDVNNDTELGVEWLNAPYGMETMRLLGNVLPDDFATDFATEKKRLIGMMESESVLAWAIHHNGQTVGMVEAKLEPFEDVPAPNIIIFIGDPRLRCRGIGATVLELVLYQLHELGYREAYARALLDNLASSKMLQKVGFRKQGRPYTDKDRLKWQMYRIDTH